ncbi:hypothetical protein [Streptomyces sp. NPDC056188]|uniref:hypothetical protein n=1 Tax=Streptomyces sp. NPDC056188 TaxID=3345740 RepID=UPI0035D5F982
MIWLAITAAAAAGYLIGRLRPYDRLATWVNWELRFHLDRWTSKPRQVALFSLLLLTDPVRTVHAWRHRHDPPPPKSPLLKFRKLTHDEDA